ncbi:transcriptional regulator, XRE family with cupin sensor [Actinomadura glauciflava]|uniref:helix-turn-helix domain-containing protein n=1 Tax=Actinomadura luteofluorescens TaxID=46163 RepID=UPI002164960C|nr:XRE family transcriptional regulator [Actinomadura glauciflava]MCR3738843.1 transcriptional regulator, XRE family with cupin sensor [Actinomadura glauciflava]
MPRSAGPTEAGRPGNPTPSMAVVGNLVRELRHAAGLSIAALAQASDLSPGLLSQIERGQGNPSFTTLVKLSQALDVPVGRFFLADTEAGALVRAGTHRRLLLADENLEYTLITPHMNGRLGMIKAQVAAGWSNESAPFEHPGEECILITEGELMVCIAGTVHTLHEGDSITYDSGLSHWYRNATDRNAVLVGAMTPPSF